LSKGGENALLLVAKTIDKIMTNEIQLKDLMVSKLLRQDLTSIEICFHMFWLPFSSLRLENL
jgi:hypothetical protein